MKKPKTAITDHALMRYIERVCNWPISKLKEDLLKKLPQKLPDGIIKINGIEFRCKNNCLVTVVTKKPK